MKTQHENEERSGGNYPYYPLAKCLPVAEAVKSLSGGGKSQVSKSLLASSLNEDQRSQTLAFKLTSAKSFGMIDGRADFNLTEISKRYFFPTDETGRQGALLDFLEYPPAFKKLVERFDGSKLPTTEIISNILHRECGVPQSWKDRVATFFIKSAQYASAIDEQGHLRVKASREGRVSREVSTGESEEVELSVIGTPQSQITRQKRIAGQVNLAAKIWTFTDENRTLLVETPRDITAQEWEVLNQYVQFISPKGKK